MLSTIIKYFHLLLKRSECYVVLILPIIHTIYTSFYYIITILLYILDY
nr:MAG TPA: hypothetical protein [Caudoviricetes sp.]